MHGERTPRTFGIQLIVAYKFVKAPLMVALAIWLTLDARAAVAVGERLARTLSEGGAYLAGVGHWIHAHLTHKVVTGGAIAAWLDSISTALEGILLWMGKPWGEWLVTLGLGSLIPLELFSLARRMDAGKALVLAINTAIVAYLAWRRIRALKRHREDREAERRRPEAREESPA